MSPHLTYDTGLELFRGPSEYMDEDELFFETLFRRMRHE